jgi:hypothetical protein
MIGDTKRFRVAFSFAGARRAYVRKLACLLARKFGQKAILYDKFHQAEFAQAELGKTLPDLFYKESELVVVVLCSDYESREWCGLEWNAVLALIKEGGSAKVMLCRFDHVLPRGLFSIAGFVELDSKSARESTALILERLALNNDSRDGSAPSDAPRVSIAEAGLRKFAVEGPLPALPYPLLAPYEHPRTFAGREAEVSRLVALIETPPLVLGVHAPSGTGKSSLLLAGVAPQLRGKGYAVSVERAPSDPGLAQRILDDLLNPVARLPPESDATLPAEFAKGIHRAQILSEKPVILFLDQFDDVLRNVQHRTRILARIGPLIAATAQRLAGTQGFACKWVLCYRREFHGTCGRGSKISWRRRVRRCRRRRALTAWCTIFQIRKSHMIGRFP